MWVNKEVYKSDRCSILFAVGMVFRNIAALKFSLSYLHHH